MTGNLPIWIQRLLGLDVELGHGVAWRIVWTSTWPDWIWWAIVAIGIGTALVPYLRRSTITRSRRYKLATIRLMTVTILMLMIAQPELQLEKTDLPTFAVVIDDSMSMTISDEETSKPKEDGSRSTKEKTRLDQAKSVLLAEKSRLLRKMFKRYRTDVYRLSDMSLLGEENRLGLDTLVKEIEKLKATGPTSRLGDAVTSILGQHFGAEPAGILLLTDGINTEGSSLKEAATSAKRLGVPLYTVGIGSEKTKPRLMLSELSVEEVVFVGDTLRFQALLHGPGHEGKTVHVDLYRKEIATPQHKATLLDETTLTIPPDGVPLPIQLHYAPQEEGTHTFLVSIREEKGSELQRTVQAYKEQIRVLLAASRPSYEYRFLRNLLRREPSIQPTTYLADADPRSVEQDPIGTPVFPIRREEIFEYDVVILIDVAPRQLGHRTMENLTAFVEETHKGGAIVFIAGPNVPPSDYQQTPLAQLLPVDVEQLQMPDDDRTIVDGFHVTPTDDGLQQPPLQLGNTSQATRTIWHELPPLYWMLKAESLKKTARVWAVNERKGGRHLSSAQKTSDLPVLVMQYAGAGRVLMQLTDETWRWRAEDQLDAYNRYWLQTIRYMARSKLIGSSREITLSTDKTNYHQGETVQLRLKFHDPRLAPGRDDGVQLSISRQDGPTESMTLKRTGSRSTFTGSLPQPTIGNYHAWLRRPSLESSTPPPSIDFTIEAPPGEFAETWMNAEELLDVSKQTAGRFFTIADGSEIASVLPKGHSVTIEPLLPLPLWNHWLVLATLLALLTIEWTFRRRWGL